MQGQTPAVYHGQRDRRVIEINIFTMSFASVNVPVARGGFGAPAGGGGQDPRKPGSNKPGREHYEEAATLINSKAIRREAKKESKKQH